MKQDKLEGSGHTPMYNPHILPLKYNFWVINSLFLRKIFCPKYLKYHNIEEKKAVTKAFHFVYIFKI